MLAEPVVVVEDLVAPEGIDIRGNRMYVVEGGTETLTQVNLRNGRRSTIACDLGLQAPSPLGSFGWFDDVNVVGNDIYVNADRAMSSTSSRGGTIAGGEHDVGTDPA